MESKSPSYRFDFLNVDAWTKHLTDKGFVVIGGVVPQKDCQRIVGEMKEVLKKFSPQLTDDEKTWTVGKNYPYLLHGGDVQYVGHTKWQWELREKAAPVFAKLWKCKETELASSYEGFCFMNGARRYRSQAPLSDVHTNQSPKKDTVSYQGLVNLVDNEDNDGGLVVIPESHKAHKELFKRLGKADIEDDNYKFSDEEKKDAIFSKFIKVNGKAGDIMLWDLRTLHCQTIPTSQNIRACQYVSQIPKDKVYEKTKKKRDGAWAAKRCTNQCPGEGIEVYPVVPRYGDASIKEIAPTTAVSEEKLTDLQKSLLFIK